MNNNVKLDRLIVPIYINEKIVLDMLAILEDGFSMVSQINYTEHKESNSSQNIDANASTSATILSKLLKMDVSGELNHSGNKGENESITKEKVHTNVSLLSKFRQLQLQSHILHSQTKRNISQYVHRTYAEKALYIAFRLKSNQACTPKQRYHFCRCTPPLFLNTDYSRQKLSELLTKSIHPLRKEKAPCPIFPSSPNTIQSIRTYKNIYNYIFNSHKILLYTPLKSKPVFHNSLRISPLV